MNVYKQNESYSIIEGSPSELNVIYQFLKVERPGAKYDPLVQRGFRSPFEFFAKYDRDHKVLRVFNGHLFFVKKLYPKIEIPKYTTKFTSNQIDDYFKNVKDKLPFQPYDFQEKAFKESILNVRQISRMATSSGKSLTISLIADFYRTQKLRGLLIVPNINLLTQFKSDIKEYNLTDLYNNTELLGGDNKIDACTFDKSLTISTWQSMVRHKDKLSNFDYLICDEVHQQTKDVSGDIIKSLINVDKKLGFTGTLPENKSDSMYLLGLFGNVKTYITPNELIKRGLGTPIKINTLYIKYPNSIITKIRSTEAYPQQVKIIEEDELKNKLICDLAVKLKNLKQNTLVLFSHTAHGKELFKKIMRNEFPDVEIQEKYITGKKSFDFQNQYHIFFLNGEDDAKTRENTRKILEHYDDAILISNYKLLSTGVSIHRLYNLIFAGSLKSYNTITQSLGRGMRLYKNKKEFKVFDLVDLCYNSRRIYSGVFYKQYKHRVETSYIPESYPISENIIDFSKDNQW